MRTDGEGAEDCIWEQVLLSDDWPSEDLDFDVDVQIPQDWQSDSGEVDHA